MTNPATFKDAAQNLCLLNYPGRGLYNIARSDRTANFLAQMRSALCLLHIACAMDTTDKPQLTYQPQG